MRISVWAIGLGLLSASPVTAVAALDFNRDVRPILSDKCFSCHGPDESKRKAKLRLDGFDVATKARDGRAAVVPGKPESSEAVRRIHSADADEMMPPPESKKSLSADEKARLVQWIREGARFDRHWAFEPPKRPSLPKPPPADESQWHRRPADESAGWHRRPADESAGWHRRPADESQARPAPVTHAKNPDPTASPPDPPNAIDAFIRARLEKEGLAPAPEASKQSLLRRVTFDLTGLPPTIDEIDAFVSDRSPDAYERVVVRLLESPRFGERMCLHWLDLARYADTHGYHLDSGREMWRWREWVIDAFNRNLPFDRFVREQLAGDLLPDATRDQILATGFCRNNMVNFEGGAIAEEYLNAYLVDRVTTFSTVFLGLTMNCCQCHDHKFDPLTMRDFYGLYAYFNAVPEKGLDGNTGNAAPFIKVPTAPQDLKWQKLRRELAEAEGAAEPSEAEAVEETRERLEAAKRALAEFEKSIPTAMVMQQMEKPRTTHILMRGQYNQPGDAIVPQVPVVLGAVSPGAPPDRRALADWLTARDHPLLSRVTVNRFWAMIFGTGLVKTANDFGFQGEWPSHPELLDWLAVEFIESGWDVKRLIKTLVTSHAYRQHAAVPPELVSRDPENRLLARGPRKRLPAEFIRDSVLAISGLLDSRIGGPSVLPYQPAGLWEELNSRGDSDKWTGQKFVPSQGVDLYRRGFYTYWKRTCPPPNLGNFDAPDRETCIVQRPVTNTPLQALTLLNDPVFVEPARVFAGRVLRENADDRERIARAFRMATGRTPSAAESAILVDLLGKHRVRFTNAPAEAAALVAVGDASRDAALDPVEHAAWTSVAATILNLDEAITQ